MYKNRLILLMFCFNNVFCYLLINSLLHIPLQGITVCFLWNPVFWVVTEPEREIEGDPYLVCVNCLFNFYLFLHP